MDLYLIFSPYGETVLKTEISAEDKQLEYDGELEIYKVSAPASLSISRVTSDESGNTADTPLEAEPVG
jgi:hypothetical protein